MNELDRFIKDVNLVFTNTINRIDFCRVDFDINSQKINYENTINLYKLVSSFNKLYISFKKKYDSLNKLELGKDLKILRFDKFNVNAEKYRMLVIDIIDPVICDYDYTILYICEKDQHIYSFITSGGNPLDKNFYKKDIKLDSISCKKYLDLFEEHQLLLETYEYLKSKFVYGDGTNVLRTRIHGNLLDNLTCFEIDFGQAFINTEFSVDLFINLGKNLNIDVDKCEIILDSESITPNKEITNKLLNEVHVNKKYLKRK